MSPVSPPLSRVRLVAAFAAVYLVWGSTYLAIRVAIETLPGFLMAGTRFLFAGGILYAFGRLRGGERPTLRHWGAAAVIGALLLLVGNGCVVWAEHRVPSSLAALLVATEPLWIVLFDWARPGGVRPAPLEIGGVVLGFAGVAILIGPVDARGAADPLSAAVLVLSTLAWASGSLYSRGARLPKSASVAIGMRMLAGGALLFLAGTADGEWSRFDIASVSLRSVVALAYLSVFGSIVAFSAYMYLLATTTVARASTYAYVNPVVAVSLGYFAGGEPVTGRTVAATAVIVGAVAVITTVQSGAEARAAAAARAARKDEVAESAGI